MPLDAITNTPKPKKKKVSWVVPWYNPSQFRKVYEYLYSNELKKKRWAVDQIYVWEYRCHPSLPVAIEASLVISNAIIQDILKTNDSSLSSQYDIQMLYSMALVRFVNLTIEPHNKLKHASGVQIAKGLGIPSWVVDLRNESTHSFLPSLSALRMAADSVMKYLNESYWEKEASTLESKIIRDTSDEEVRSFIHGYIRVQYRILNDLNLEKYSGSEKHKRDVAELNEILKFLAIVMEKHKKKFIEILVSDGYFIPYDEELKKLMSKNDYSDFQEDSYEPNSIPTSVPPVPPELELLWKKALCLMHNAGILPQFIEELLKYPFERSDVGKKLVVAWVLKILRILSLGECHEDTHLKKIFTKRYTVLNWKTLFHAAVSYPSIYTPMIFPLIFSHLNLNRQYTQYILDLMAIKLGQADWESHELPKDYDIQTLESLKHMMRLQDTEKIRRTSRRSVERLWSYADEEDYGSWPIGMIVNPVEDDYDCEEYEPEIEYEPVSFVEKMDHSDKYFLNNENDIDVNCFPVIENPDLYEEVIEIDLGDDDRQSFLYKMK